MRYECEVLGIVNGILNSLRNNSSTGAALLITLDGEYLPKMLIINKHAYCMYAGHSNSFTYIRVLSETHGPR